MFFKGILTRLPRISKVHFYQETLKTSLKGNKFIKGVEKISVISIKFNEEEEIIRKYIESKETNISQYVKKLYLVVLKKNMNLKY